VQRERIAGSSVVASVQSSRGTVRVQRAPSGDERVCIAGVSWLSERLFINRYGAPLTASGFRFRLRQYVRSAAVKQPTLSQKRITPHVFRHSTAVHLVAAGVDVTVIRSWLGHAHLDTTNHYAQANLETKRKALEQADPSLRGSKPPRWKRDTDLLAWLDSL
jgi:site-specific recombinase XerD